MIAAMVAAAALGAVDIDRLAWMAGAWIEEKAGVVTRETWLAPMDGVMAGANQTNRLGRAPQVEHMTIRAGPAGAAFTAYIGGQPPVAFQLRPGPDDRAVFENLAHDFPQRVIYRRCGADLCARIEGVVGGEARSMDWRFRRAP
jgi:hypothetical protein